MKRVLVMAGAVAALLGAGRSAVAVVAYDNLGTGTNYGSFGYGNFGLIDGNFVERGTEFTASQTVALSTLQVVIGQAYWDGTTYSGAASIALMSDAGNTPGSVIETWTSSAQSSFTGGVETLTSGVRPTLSAGTKYWVVMGDAAGSYLGGAWYFADAPQPGYAWVSWRPSAGAAVQTTQLTRGYRTRVSGDLSGDANLDGQVDAADYALIDRGFAKHASGWANGDFNGDGQVTAADYLLIDTGYAQAHGGHVPEGVVAEREVEFGDGYVSALATAVPEPGAGVVVIGMAAGLVRRRR